MPDALHFPWWLIVACGIAAVICLYKAAGQPSRRLKQTGLGLLILALALAAIRIFSPTDIERVEQSTRDLCQSAVASDWTRFSSFLDPNIAVGASPGDSTFTKPQQVTYAAKTMCESFKVTAIKVTKLQSTQTGNTITTQCNVTTFGFVPDLGENQPVPSSWTLEWRRSGNTWLLDRATMTQLAGQAPSDLLDLARLKMH